MSTIIKPNIDNRTYKFITLENGLKVMLISDPEADKSAASLDVGVGSSLDPVEFYGTAHFLEHMLFQGTEKYPDESEYGVYISNHGGSNNAYTDDTDTNFHFDVSNDGFEGALDRLAQFFICPTFTESSTQREVNAVDSEFNMATQSDGWHAENLFQQLSNKDSFLHKFSCGNLDTLSKDGVRENLLAFHERWYSSNIMTLTVYGNHEINQL